MPKSAPRATRRAASGLAKSLSESGPSLAAHGRFLAKGSIPYYPGAAVSRVRHLSGPAGRRPAAPGSKETLPAFAAGSLQLVWMVQGVIRKCTCSAVNPRRPCLGKHGPLSLNSAEKNEAWVG